MAFYISAPELPLFGPLTELGCCIHGSTFPSSMDADRAVSILVSLVQWCLSVANAHRHLFLQPNPDVRLNAPQHHGTVYSN